MKYALDSSVLIAGMCASDPDHSACRELLVSAQPVVFGHALSETFSTLTGGRLGFRVPVSAAARLLRKQVVPKLRIVHLETEDQLSAYDEAEARGVRAGAVYDFLHLVAARKAGVKRFYTLNLDDFLAFHRPGDPEVLAP